MSGSATLRRGPRLNGSAADRTRRLEQDVMDLFDAGLTRGQIAATLEVPADRVRMVLSYMAPKPTDLWICNATRSSDLLVEAIRQHHPDQLQERAS